MGELSLWVYDTVSILLIVAKKNKKIPHTRSIILPLSCGHSNIMFDIATLCFTYVVNGALFTWHTVLFIVSDVCLGSCLFVYEKDRDSNDSQGEITNLVTPPQ